MIITNLLSAAPLCPLPLQTRGQIADLDQLTLPDRRGDTPLHAAAFHGNRECLLLLLQFGAPPTTPNSKG